MPPPAEIPAFDPRFLRPCTFALLRELGYGTRISINNGIGPGHELAIDMSMSMSVFADGGNHLATTPEIDRLAPGQITKVSIDDLLDDLDEVPDEGQVLCMLHMVPVDLLGTDAVDMPSKTMMAHVSASDDFIEYHQRPKGVVTGVAYQTGPLNDRRLSSTRSTVCQAPKVIVAEPVDTLMLLMNVSTSFDYDDTVRMDFWILGPGGERVARSHVEVPPFSFRLVSTTQVLEQAGALDDYRAGGGVGMFLGYSKNGTVVPISLTRNRESGAIACDHTLPPVFYLSTWGGEARLQANARLEQEFFADVPAEEPAAAEAIAR
jgi:hypothetical protein